MSEIGLRERKKRRMYRTVSDIAVRLFLERGFDAVSVAEVAAAAEISKPTLFRYFPAKEDLVLFRIADHEDEAARVAGEGPTPVEALRRHFLDGLRRQPSARSPCWATWRRAPRRGRPARGRRSCGTSGSRTRPWSR
ncbi:hypothetical protein SGRIM128S_04360 [Streptomyces griseomycini]